MQHQVPFVGFCDLICMKLFLNERVYIDEVKSEFSDSNVDLEVT